jgi:hypothetical protein
VDAPSELASEKAKIAAVDERNAHTVNALESWFLSRPNVREKVVFTGLI